MIKHYRYGSTDSLAGRFGYLWIDDDEPAVLASGWVSGPAMAAAGFDEPVPMLLGEMRRDLRDAEITDGQLDRVDDAVTRYSDGDLEAIDDISVRQHSGPFSEEARRQLRAVLPGSRPTYSELAARSGRPDAIRAAASACAHNAAALFVPCHRIVRIGGALGGFRYGLPIKAQLLAHEDAHR